MMTYASVTSVNYVMGHVLHGSRAVRRPNPNPHYNPNHTLNLKPQTTSMTLTLTLTHALRRWLAAQITSLRLKKFKAEHHAEYDSAIDPSSSSGSELDEATIP